ncbi:serine/threonine-protein phosphatase [Amycolatopsis sp., V23-08]|uniref:Serine/threonine-protein phosphatase n=1 Tax=Amycolatopsis heterodermiae TaxID=3110235 RepID=A0ABU5R450_9PSEU|nr:serine/threonine-protein phosphatase [Amycolatopsis sp., V23-08]MEA5360986.1 serine/threonine-protein phosphatase [Amycolatopsis sp., V23-08]
MSPDPERSQQEQVAACFRRSRLTLEQLWTRYFALGGAQTRLDVDAYLHGLVPLPRIDRDMLAHAVNERLDELSGPRRAPYSRPLPATKPEHGPLRALVDLLEGTHLAPPERLPSVVARAGRALDLRIRVYLADYDQRLLVPLPSAGSGPLDIETTVAGDVFRRAGTAVESGVLWTVLLDGVERLGVLEIEPTAGTDPEDPVLRQQSDWLATLIGHLVTVMTQYGDGLDVQRRQQHRDSPAELLWQALPPLTGATEAVVVGASVRPAYELCATAFDYALSEHRAHLALFDAEPGGSTSGLAIVAALSAYRATRRDGAALAGQHEAVGEAAGAPAISGVVAELDVRTGDLHVLATGPEAPVLIHGGEAGGTHERLRPGELVAFSSRWAVDGESAFGRAGVAEVLRRYEDLPVPEIAHRITEAVAGHYSDELPRDLGVVVVRWTPSS